MIKKTLPVLLLLFLPSFLFSQGFKGGLLAGITATQVDGDGIGGYNRAGFVGGFWVSRKFSDPISIRTELKFIQKGSHKRFTDGTGLTTGEYSLRLNYAEMPFLAEWHFRDDIIPFAGISIGYLWKPIEKSNGYENPIDEETAFKKFEFAGNAGVDYKINSKLSFCFNFSYSILPVRRHTGNIFYLWDLDFGQYNNVLQFCLRYHY